MNSAFTLAVQLIANFLWTIKSQSYYAIVHIISVFYPYLVAVSTTTFQSPQSMQHGLDNGCPTLQDRPDHPFSLLALTLNYPHNHAIPTGIVNMGWFGPFLVVKRKYMVSVCLLFCVLNAMSIL